MWRSWIVEDLNEVPLVVGGLVLFLLRFVQCHLDHYFRNISASIDNYAKDGGGELFTRMHCVRIRNL